MSHKQTNLYAWVTEPHLLGLVDASVGLRNLWSGRRSDALANKQVSMLPPEQGSLGRLWLTNAT
jgi:hypothetical protein